MLIIVYKVQAEAALSRHIVANRSEYTTAYLGFTRQ